MATPLCPRDSTPLVQTPDALGPNAPALTCPRCAGVMLDWKTAQPFFQKLGFSVQDLQTLVKQAAAKPRATPPPACTSCGTGSMKPFVLKGTELDLCESCGAVWLDRGELSRITGGKVGAAQPTAPQAVAGLREETVGVYEMFWDCAFCGAKALLGKSNRFCPQCGAPQDATRRYFPPEGQEVKANATYDGADRECPACKTPNGAKANNCKHCGSPLDGSQRVATQADRVKGAQVPVAGQVKAPAKKSRLPWILGGVGLVLFTFCTVAALWKKDVAVEVAKHTWTREIDIEMYRPRSESAWCDSKPGDAYDVSRSREQRSTRQIPDGEECSTRDVDRGDGTFERKRECRPRYRSEPVYDYKCYYKVDRWGVERTAKSEGAGLDPEPYWPEFTLARTGTCIGCERESSHRENYVLHLKGPDDTYTCDGLAYPRWKSIQDGLKKTIKVGVITKAADCDML